MRTARRKWSLEELHARFDENAPQPVVTYPEPPPICDLVGRVISSCGTYDPPTGKPFRPYRKDASQTLRTTHDSLSFAVNGGYRGSWQLGWQHPYVRINSQTRKVIERRGWAPYMSWGMWRQLPGRHNTETHHEWQWQIEYEEPEMIAKLNEALNPNLALSGSQSVFVITASPAATFERYVAAYVQRPKTLEWIEGVNAERSWLYEP